MHCTDCIASTQRLHHGRVKKWALYRRHNRSTLAVPRTVCGTVGWDRFWFSLRSRFWDCVSSSWVRLALHCYIDISRIFSGGRSPVLTQLERKTHGWGDTHGGFLLKARLTQGALWPERDVGVFAILKYRGAALRGSRCCTGYSLLAGRWHQDGQASLALISFQLRGTPLRGRGEPELS